MASAGAAWTRAAQNPIGAGRRSQSPPGGANRWRAKSIASIAQEVQPSLEVGGQGIKQHAGPVPPDAPPSDAELAVMELAEAVAALQVHVVVARVAEKACLRLRYLCTPLGSEEAAAGAGLIEAILEAMRAHPQVAEVQQAGCSVLGNLCEATDALGLARSQRAAEAGALEVVAAAMRAHLEAVSLQLQGCNAMGNACNSIDAAGMARKHRAAEAGVIEEVVAALRAHPEVADVQVVGCTALSIVCGRNADAASCDRRRRATQTGGRTAAVAAMEAHLGDFPVQSCCKMLLRLLPEG